MNRKPLQTAWSKWPLVACNAIAGVLMYPLGFMSLRYWIAATAFMALFAVVYGFLKR